MKQQTTVSDVLPDGGPMTKREATAIVKSINRWVRKTRSMRSVHPSWGVDFRTWSILYPQTAYQYQAAARVLAGRDGNFLPKGL